jgi:hypothetical protein
MLDLGIGHCKKKRKKEKKRAVLAKTAFWQIILTICNVPRDVAFQYNVFCLLERQVDVQLIISVDRKPDGHIVYFRYRYT